MHKRRLRKSDQGFQGTPPREGDLGSLRGRLAQSEHIANRKRSGRRRRRIRRRMIGPPPLFKHDDSDLDGSATNTPTKISQSLSTICALLNTWTHGLNIQVLTQPQSQQETTAGMEEHQNNWTNGLMGNKNNGPPQPQQETTDGMEEYLNNWTNGLMDNESNGPPQPQQETTDGMEKYLNNWTNEQTDKQNSGENKENEQTNEMEQTNGMEEYFKFLSLNDKKNDSTDKS